MQTGLPLLLHLEIFDLLAYQWGQLPFATCRECFHKNVTRFSQNLPRASVNLTRVPGEECYISGLKSEEFGAGQLDIQAGEGAGGVAQL